MATPLQTSFLAGEIPTTKSCCHSNIVVFMDNKFKPEKDNKMWISIKSILFCLLYSWRNLDSAQMSNTPHRKIQSIVGATRSGACTIRDYIQNQEHKSQI